MKDRSCVIPCLRYDNAPAAIDFLCNAFGFARHVVYADPSEPEVIHHAELVLGQGMIMLGSDRPDETARLYGWTTARKAGGVTQTICCVVDDPDAHAARAAHHGAVILRGPYDNPGYQGRAYDVTDCEGNVWNFGSYDPWRSAG